MNLPKERIPMSKRIGSGKFAAAAGLLAGLISLFLFSVIASGCGSTETPAETATGAVGKLEIPETQYDFGSVPVGETVKHSFEIKNTGEGVLELGEPDVVRLEGC